jgi:hypothetical protein
MKVRATMSVWLSEKEFRQSGAASAGVTINVAFLQEIKTDFGFRDLLNQAYLKLKPHDPEERVSPHVAANLLSDLRDEMETYFALEEFYGYFGESAVNNPNVSKKAVELRSDHEKLFLRLSDLVETAQQIVYHEAGPEVCIEDVADGFEQLCMDLAEHEQAEMELMMRLCNEDIGVGD